jgi:hypothetical protein
MLCVCIVNNNAIYTFEKKNNNNTVVLTLELGQKVFVSKYNAMNEFVYDLTYIMNKICVMCPLENFL